MKFFKNIKSAFSKDRVVESVIKFTGVHPTETLINLANNLVDSPEAKTFFMIGFISLGQFLEENPPNLYQEILEYYMKEN